MLMRQERQTRREKRIMHGKQGQGRFRALYPSGEHM